MFGLARALGPCAFLAPLLFAEPVLSEEPEGGYESQTHFRSWTYAALLSRAPTPGPLGAQVQSDQSIPVVEFVRFEGRGLDTGFGHDTATVEVSAWSQVRPFDMPSDHVPRFPYSPYDADVQTASLRLEAKTGSGLTWVRLGRQVQAGGAARFSRFDGMSAGVAVIPELSLGAYGGFSVLPRWDRRPGYYHLGSASESLLRSPDLTAPPDRAKNNVAGARIDLELDRFSATLSAHHQREDRGTERSNLGLNAYADPWDELQLGGAALLELDSGRLANARVFADVDITEDLLFSGQYLRSEPALLLSRQSVLSVFSIDDYQEVGGSLDYSLTRHFTVSTDGWLQFRRDMDPGPRLGGQVRYATHETRSTVVTLAYRRVDPGQNGYNAVILSASHELFPQLRGTWQSFVYLYDEEISDHGQSIVNAATIGYDLNDRWGLLWAGTVASTPYASADASTQLRLSYDLHGPARGGAW